MGRCRFQHDPGRPHRLLFGLHETSKGLPSPVPARAVSRRSSAAGTRRPRQRVKLLADLCAAICPAGRLAAPPAFIARAHELIHAYRNLLGRSNLLQSEPLFDEFEVIGLGRHPTAEITENKIRTEHGLDVRTVYDPLPGHAPPDFVGVPADGFESFQDAVQTKLAAPD